MGFLDLFRRRPAKVDEVPPPARAREEEREVAAVPEETLKAEPETSDRVGTRRAEPRAVRARTVRVDRLDVVDLSGVESIRQRIKGSGFCVTDDQRRRHGGREYLLIREPNNEADVNAVAVYGKGRRVGYLSAARAAALAPILDGLDGDAYRVTGEGVSSTSVRMWVDVPRVPALRAFAKSR